MPKPPTPNPQLSHRVDSILRNFQRYIWAEEAHGFVFDAQAVDDFLKKRGYPHVPENSEDFICFALKENWPTDPMCRLLDDSVVQILENRDSWPLDLGLRILALLGPPLKEIDYIARDSIRADTLKVCTAEEIDIVMGEHEARRSGILDLWKEYQRCGLLMKQSAFYVRPREFFAWAFAKGLAIPRAYRHFLRGCDARPPETKQKAGRKADPDQQRKDARLLAAHQTGSSFAFLAENYNITVRDVKRACDRARKREENRD